ncbi:response regulator [Corynebacterium sp. 335C]
MQDMTGADGLSGAGGPVRVALVDDQMLVRAGFGMVIESQDDMTIAWEAGDGAQALERQAADPADVILMDVRMPGMDGIEATRRITEAVSAAPEGGPATRVLVLTTYDVDEYVTRAIAAGASGFLLKDAGPDQLLEAVRDVARGESALSASSAAKLLRMVRPLLDGERDDAPGGGHGAGAAGSGAGAAGGPGGSGAAGGAAGAAAGFDGRGGDVELPEPLTAREEEILRLMALGRTNGEISEELYIAMPTVKTHVGRILMKTGSRDRIHAVLFALRTGRVGVGELD